MNWLLGLGEIEPSSEVGGKARALAALCKQGLKVPRALCLTADAYRFFVGRTGLDQLINLELGKKDFANMRWEEIWDISLRLRNAFIKAEIPAELADGITGRVQSLFGDRPVSVRSSSLAEDSARTSFAGLHESYVNLSGAPGILKHIKLVWASLWSDRALLYRRELGLDPFESAMAVLVQLMVVGQSSGVAFSMSPVNSRRASLEAVYGLNQGLVDGSIEPDHWELDRADGGILEHRPARRGMALRPGPEGAVAEPLTQDQRENPPLQPSQVTSIYKTSRRLEQAFGAPQDVEWTIDPHDTHILQSRNITTLADPGQGDERKRYLGLKRSLENLKSLRQSIETKLIPGMELKARELAAQELDRLGDRELAREITRRRDAVKSAVADYWRECIPFAHGMRLFGQVYNDRLEPRDPYEFMQVLSGAGLMSTERNRRLSEMGRLIAADQALAVAAEKGRDLAAHPDFVSLVDDFIARFGGASWAGRELAMNRLSVARLAGRFASRPDTQDQAGPAGEELERAFLDSFSPGQRPRAMELLEIGKASYRLRDDDNIYLGKLEGELARAVAEGLRRLEDRWGAGYAEAKADAVATALESNRPPALEEKATGREARGEGFSARARQLVGQPAGQGWASGPARVVEKPEDLFEFQNGEVLVCDAIDPNMTFIAPLAAAIVERRGGMLIHGAIIAREQGIPCVTGVPEATRLISTGQAVSVDGYLGLVTVGGNSLPRD